MGIVLKCLIINMHKYVLILCTEQDVLGLGWSGRIIHRGMICRHLGYPIGVEVSHVKLINEVYTMVLVEVYSVHKMVVVCLHDKTK